MQLNDHLFEQSTIDMVHDNFDQPIDTQNMTYQSNFNLMATSERALQFKQEIDNMEEMLQNTNSINFEELHSESQRSFRNETHQNHDSQNYHQNKKMNENKRTEQRSVQFKDNEIYKEANTKNVVQNTINNRQISNQMDNKIAKFSFDFNEVRKSKQINIQQALQENLRAKKQQIIELEARYIDLTHSQNVKLTKLSQFKKQREYYQQQYNFACVKRKNEMDTIKEQLKKIDSKIQEYNQMHNQTEQEINEKLTQEKAELASLQSQKDELISEVDKLQRDDGNTNYQEYNDEQPESFQDNYNHKELNKQVIDKKNQINLEKQKQHEIRSYQEKLSAFIKQSEEEQQMTQEEIDTKIMMKAELIAEREELDQMMEMGRNQGGKEFEFYLKLQEIRLQTGDENTNFVQDQYEQIKAQTFFNDIVNQMKAHPRAQEKKIFDQIELQQREVMQNIGILKISQMVQIISYLTNELDMQINEALLLEKYESSSQQKDKIFEKKSQKLDEIKREIEEYERKIIVYQNQINNILKPQAAANQQTIVDGKQRLPQLEQQIQLIDEQLKKSQNELKEIFSQVKLSHHRLKSRKGISSLKTMISELQIKIDAKQQKIQKLEIDQFSLEEQLDKSLSILKQKKGDLIGKLQILDQYAPQLSSSKNIDIGIQNPQSDDQRQDEELRQVLDTIDQKIGQIIEEKQKDGIQIQTMQKQIKEAKECFTNVYKHYKTIKKEIELHEKESFQTNFTHFNDLNNNIIPREELLKKMPRELFQSDQKSKNSVSNFDQFISFSQNSGINTPFKKIDNVIQNNPYTCFSPEQESHSKYTVYQSQDEKENFISTQKSRSSTKKNKSLNPIYIYQENSNSKNSLNEKMSNQRSLGKSSNTQSNISLSLMKQNNSVGQDKINRQLQYAFQMNKMRGINNGSSQVTFEVLNSHKKNIIALSPHVQSKSASKMESTNQKKKNSQYKNLNTSSIKKSQYAYGSKGSSSLLYNEDYMNEIFTNDDEDENNESVNQPRINPFQLDKVNDPPFQVTNPDQQDVLDDLNNDLNDVWGSSQKNIINDPSIGKIEAKTFEYNMKFQTAQNSNDKLDLSKIKRYQEEIQQRQALQNQEIEKQLQIKIQQPNANRNQKYRQFSIETAGFKEQTTSDVNTKRSPIQMEVIEQEQENDMNDSIDMKDTYVVQNDQRVSNETSKNVFIKLDTLKSQSMNKEVDIQTTFIENQENEQNMPQMNMNNGGPILTSSSMVIQPPLTTSSIVNQPNMTQSSTAIVSNMNTHKSLNNFNFNNNQELQSLNEEHVQSTNQIVQPNQGNLSDIIKSLQNLSQIQSQQRYPQTQPTQPSVTRSNRSSQMTSFPEMIPHRKNYQHQNTNIQNVYRQSIDNGHPPLQSKQVNNSFNMRQNLSHNDLMTSQNFNIPPRPMTQMSAQQLNNYQKQVHIDYSNASLPTNIHGSTPTKNGKRKSVAPHSRSKVSNFSQHTNSKIKLSLSPNNRGSNIHSKRNELLPALLPLLQGAIFYKKFSNRTSMKCNEKTFDPLKANKVPPEHCGYGIRFIQLDTSLKFVNIRQHLKNSNEIQIPISDILKPIIPSITMEIIKAKKTNQSQKKDNRRSSSQFKDFSNQKNQADLMDSLSKEHKNMSISHLVKMGVIDKNSQAFKDRCSDCVYFPFSIALKETNRDSSSKRIIMGDNNAPSAITSGKEKLDGRIELIATSYESLKAWTLGINMLLKQHNQLMKSQHGQQFE